jgi:hypothetical protein
MMESFEHWLDGQELSLRDWRREVLTTEPHDLTLLAGLEAHLEWLANVRRRSALNQQSWERR